VEEDITETKNVTNPPGEVRMSVDVHSRVVGIGNVKLIDRTVCIRFLPHVFRDDNDVSKSDNNLVHCQDVVGTIVRDGGGGGNGQAAGGSGAVIGARA